MSISEGTIILSLVGSRFLPTVSCNIGGITCCRIADDVCNAGLTFVSISHNCSGGYYGNGS